MHLVLRPRKIDILGQDFRSTMAIEKLSLTPILLNMEDQHITTPGSRINIVITFDPENTKCCNYIELLQKNIPVVTHFQLQWEYQEQENKDNSRETVRRSDAVVVPAVFLQEKLNSLFPRARIECIHNGADINVFYPTSSNERKKFKSELGIPQNEFVYIHVGRLSIPKGVQILDKFCNTVPSNCHVLFYCRESKESTEVINKLKKIRPNKIHALFDDNNPKRTKHPVRYCDALISFSLGEVAPMVVIEALLSGLPVIVTFSTPFYTELQQINLKETYFQIVPLPSRLHNLSYEKRVLKEVEAANIANSITKRSEKITLLTDTERRELSQKMVVNGYESMEMLRLYDQLYRKIALKNKTDSEKANKGD